MERFIKSAFYGEIWLVGIECITVRASMQNREQGPLYKILPSSSNQHFMVKYDWLHHSAWFHNSEQTL